MTPRPPSALTPPSRPEAPGPARTSPAARCRPAPLATDLRIAVRHMSRRIKAEKSDRDLTGTQLAAMAALEQRGPLTPTELAAHERVRPPSISPVVASLEAAGMVERSAHPTDRRQAIVRLTEAGAEELKETRRRRDAWLARRLAMLTPDERRTLAQATELMRRITAE